MPITKSAQKALRQSERRRIRNAKQKKTLKETLNAYRKAVSAGGKDAVKLLPGVFKALDKAAKRGKILKKNTASRLKSRLSKMLTK